MNLSVTARFLWLPVNRTSPVVKLHFLSEGEKLREILQDYVQESVSGERESSFVK